MSGSAQESQKRAPSRFVAPQLEQTTTARAYDNDDPNRQSRAASLANPGRAPALEGTLPLAMVMEMGPGRGGPGRETPTSLHRAHARTREGWLPQPAVALGRLVAVCDLTRV